MVMLQVAVPAVRAEDWATVSVVPGSMMADWPDWLMVPWPVPDPPAASTLAMLPPPGGDQVAEIAPPVSATVTLRVPEMNAVWSLPSFGAVHDAMVGVPFCNANWSTRATSCSNGGVAMAAALMVPVTVRLPVTP